MRDQSLAAVLGRLAAIAQSAMDSPAPIRADGSCALCTMQVAEPPDDTPHIPIVDHDPSECGWWIARNEVSQADVNEVRRLAHVLAYPRLARP